ncbi:MAG: hypothetical protein ACREXX_07930, partial [Gammaproteobacteria bacterium]
MMKTKIVALALFLCTAAVVALFPATRNVGAVDGGLDLRLLFRALLLAAVVDIDRDELPEPMQAMAPKEQEAMITEMADRRNEVQGQIKELAEK